ncbi:MAG: TonB C-terminal domain-containing protein [Verrucomicrobiales bacterium]|nr:TonB C-terminal domain-containing protein [Verrucomicrobiales bacterium]
MFAPTQPRQPRNSTRINLLISLVFHGVIILALFYFAAREGLLGTQLKKIAVELVQERAPEKPDEPEPEPERPLVEPTLAAESPPALTTAPEAPREVASAPPPASQVAAPPAVAPPAAQVPSFVFEGGRLVATASDPVQVYRGLIEYALRSNWNRPLDVADTPFVAEVELAVDRSGQLSNPAWKRGSGHARWDESVRQALAATPRLNRPPPENFPPRVLVRFDVQELADEIPVLQ